MEEYDYTLDFKVRDYELDLLGMVNNQVYQGYLEHTRHEFLKSKGFDFAETFEDGYRMVVIRAELDYKRILQSGDEFRVTLVFSQASRAKFLFEQKIFRIPDNELILDAKIYGTAMNEKGRPKLPEKVKLLFHKSQEE